MVFTEQNEIGAALDVCADNAQLRKQRVGLFRLIAYGLQQFRSLLKLRRNLARNSVVQAVLFIGLKLLFAQIELGAVQVIVLAEQLVGFLEMCGKLVDLLDVVLPQHMAAGNGLAVQNGIAKRHVLRERFLYGLWIERSSGD